MHPKLEAGLISAWHSVYFTAAGLLVGFFTFAAAQGATDSPSHLWAFTKLQWFPFAIANLVTPVLRGIVAAAKTKGTP